MCNIHIHINVCIDVFMFISIYLDKYISKHFVSRKTTLDGCIHVHHTLVLISCALFLFPFFLGGENEVIVLTMQILQVYIPSNHNWCSPLHHFLFWICRNCIKESLLFNISILKLLHLWILFLLCVVLIFLNLHTSALIKRPSP